MGQNLIALPTCEQHGQMEVVNPSTPEQAWCGTWYRCSRCGSSVLYNSPELDRYLADQKRAFVPKPVTARTQRMWAAQRRGVETSP